MLSERLRGPCGGPGEFEEEAALRWAVDFVTPRLAPLREWEGLGPAQLSVSLCPKLHSQVCAHKQDVSVLVMDSSASVVWV